MAKRRERRYAIQPSGYFDTGVTPEQEQVLMGLLCPELVAFRFDLEGNLLKIERRPVTFFQGVKPPYDIYDERIPPLIKAWQKEMRFRRTTIKVKKFFVKKDYIGIEDYPSDFQEILADPDAAQEEKAEVRASMKSWDKDGQFVLHWGNDYWLDKAGEVVSS